MRRTYACERLEELAGCDVVVEAIIEDLELKIELFRQLEGLVSDATILATNTSSLLVSAIAGARRRPGRIAGLHFFNPVPLMRLAEIIPGVRTHAATVDFLKRLIEGTGHRAVIAEDQPGFLVNHAGRGLYTEGLRILEDRIADVRGIDTLLRDAAGFRMGPFELLGYDRSRCIRQGDGIDLCPIPPGTAVPSVIPRGTTHCRRSCSGARPVKAGYADDQDQKSTLSGMNEEDALTRAARRVFGKDRSRRRSA